MATKRYAINATWKNIGKGPALIEALAPSYVHFGPSAPNDNSRDYHHFGFCDRMFLTLELPLDVWVKSSHGDDQEIIITADNDSE